MRQRPLLRTLHHTTLSFTILGLLLVALLTPPLAWAGAIHFQVDTSTISGTSAILSFELVGMGTPANTVTISGLNINAPIGTAESLGSVSGSLPGRVVLGSSHSFFNVATLSIPALSSLMTFNVDTTDLPSAQGYPDALTLHLLDASSGIPLFPTTDPSGSGALFLLTMNGSGYRSLNIYAAPGYEAIVTAQSVTLNVPAPGSVALIALGLCSLTLCRRKWFGVLTGLFFMGTAHAAEPLDAHLSVIKGPMVYNRVTDTFDTVATLTNRGATPLLGPMRLVIRDITTPGVAVYNAQGVDTDANALVDVPLDTGLLQPRASTTALIKFIDPQRLPISYGMGILGINLRPGNRTILHVRVGADADMHPAGPGIEILVNGVIRGQTGADGTLTLLAASGAADIMARRAPTMVGTNLAELPAGGEATVDVRLDDDKEVYAPATLRIDQVRQALLDTSFSAWSLRFILLGERTAPLSDLAGADLFDGTGKRVANLLPLLKLDTDGVVRPPNLAALRSFLASQTGQLELEVRAADAAGAAYYGRLPFRMANYHVSGQLTAPVSAPGLVLGGVRVIATILNTDVVLATATATDGSFVLPNLPSGNLKLDARTIQGGQLYRGTGVFPLTQDLRLSLPLLSPSGLAVAADAAAAAQSVQARRDSDSRAKEATRTPEQSRHEQASPLLGVPAFASATPSEASVSAIASAVGVPVTDSARLNIPKGTKPLVLTYIIASGEYPDWVSWQSVFNDVWGITLRADSDGSVLFEQTMQVNSQLYLPPVWQADGTTGKLTRSFDVTQLTKAGPVSVTLSAFATNIGDDQLATSVEGRLTVGSRIDINAVTAAPDTFVARNDHTYYSIPKSGNTNTFQRKFDLDISKPDDAEVQNVKVELLGAGDDVTVLDAAPGDDAQWIDDHTLRTVATFKMLPSTVDTVPPPSSATRYRFTLKAKDAAENTLEATKTDVEKHPLWRMPPSLPRFGGRDPGGDDWCTREAYAWLEQNAALLEPINDVSGEHGKNLGHDTHAQGSDIDMYHFYRFAGAEANNGTSNYERLVARLQDLPKLTSANPVMRAQGENARNQVRAWITATRSGIDRLAALDTVSQVGYIRNGPGASGIAGADWGAALLRTGRVTVNGTVFDLSTGTWDNAKYFPWPNHHHHVHITLNLSN